MRRRGQGSKWIRPVRRLAIYMRDGYRCVYCEDFGLVMVRHQVRHAVPLSLDHLQPQCLGGGTENTNLVTCCWRCNTVRHTQSAEDFIVSIAQEVKGWDDVTEALMAIEWRLAWAVAKSGHEEMGQRIRWAKHLCERSPEWLIDLRQRSSNTGFR